MDMVIIKNLMILYNAKLVNYIHPWSNSENLLTSSSTAKVSAKIDLLQVAQITADSWQRVSTKTIQNCFAHCGFKPSGLEMPNMANSEIDALLEMHVRNY
jgi:hypothetical protein